MTRPANHSSSSLAVVRRYFGLEQQELAQYLGVSRGLVAHIEAGRREPSATVLMRLMPLAEQVPPPLPAPAEAPATYLPPPEPAPDAAPEAGPLQARIAECRYQAGKLRQELGKLYEELRGARRWQQALPALLAAEPFRATPEEVARLPLVRGWLRRRGEEAAVALNGRRATRYHLLTARAEALEAEAAALERVLPI